MNYLNAALSYDHVAFNTKVVTGAFWQWVKLPGYNGHTQGLEVCASGNDGLVPRAKAPGTLKWCRYVEVFQALNMVDKWCGEELSRHRIRTGSFVETARSQP